MSTNPVQPEPVRIREARVEDAAAIATVYNAAARAGWASFLPGAETMDVPAERFADGVAAPGVTTLAAERGGEVVGFAQVLVPAREPVPDAGELEMLYTHPSVWGEGVGRSLLAAAVERLRACGCTAAVLWTAAANDRPRRVYETAGWRPDGTRRTRSWRGTTFEELRYALPLEHPKLPP